MGSCAKRSSLFRCRVVFAEISGRVHQSALIVLVATGLVAVLAGNPQAKDLPSASELVKTIWVTNGYSYVSVTPDGTADSFSGVTLYIEFTELRGGFLMARSRWISPEEKLGEFQHLLFLPNGPGLYSFQAAGAPNAVGGAANGNMRLISETEAAYTSFNLENNRAGAFITTLTKVDTLPAKFRGDN